MKKRRKEMSGRQRVESTLQDEGSNQIKINKDNFTRNPENESVMTEERLEGLRKE